MTNYTNGPEIPQGLGMALAQNLDAMRLFSLMTDDARQRIIDHTHTIQSKEEMQVYVQSLVGSNLN